MTGASVLVQAVKTQQAQAWARQQARAQGGQKDENPVSEAALRAKAAQGVAQTVVSD